MKTTRLLRRASLRKSRAFFVAPTGHMVAIPCAASPRPPAAIVLPTPVHALPMRSFAGQRPCRHGSDAESAGRVWARAVRGSAPHKKHEAQNPCQDPFHRLHTAFPLLNSENGSAATGRSMAACRSVSDPPGWSPRKSRCDGAGGGSSHPASRRTPCRAAGP